MKKRISISQFLLKIVLLLVISSLSYAQETVSKSKEKDAFNELDNKSLTIRFYDALLGLPIKGALVKIGEEKFETDYEGAVSFKNTNQDQSLKVFFECKNYIPSEFEINITAGSLFFNRFSVSPVLPIGSLRMVLDWGSAPKDLDANILKKDDYHISFRNMKVSADGIAKLDIDDTDGLGPETITINKIEPFSEYIYFIHNFSDKHNAESTSLSNSRAMVKLFGDNKLLNVFSIPLDKSGNYWEVFRIVDGQLKVIDEVKAGIE